MKGIVKMWLFLDIIIVAIFVVLAVIGAKRGFIKSVLGIGVVIISILITMNFYTYLADFFRGTVVYKNLTDNLNEKIEDYISTTMDEERMKELFDQSPTGISSLLAGFGLTTQQVSEKYSEIILSGEENVSQSIAEYIVAPAANTLSGALAVLVMFVVCIIVLNLVVRLLDMIFKLPVLNFANRAGGFFIGILMAFLFCFVFCTVVNISLPYLPGLGISIDREGISQTVLFSSLSEMNPLAFLYNR